MPLADTPTTTSLSEQMSRLVITTSNGLEIDLVRFDDPQFTGTTTMAITQESLAVDAFDRMYCHLARFLNVQTGGYARRIMLPSVKGRTNPRYKPADVRPHTVILISRYDEATPIASVGAYLQIESLFRKCKRGSDDPESYELDSGGSKVAQFGYELGVIERIKPI